ncbi:MAG: porin family protein [Prevotella sp.]|uniref:porin family protein n=1 Tax=Prevotella sp. TaxID=59823 RepID=UPI002A2BEECD|nr:porin family protein [Prevotella sp.]MDD7317947.1 porin family protein [Prevotellaceae bacterium]MDY4020838.1 porin family protein [Prevotella sp.]
MKKTFTLILFALAMMVALPSQAQVKFGLRAGLNVTNMSLDKKVFNTKNRTGFFVGPTVKFTLPIVGVGIDASALYDQREAELENSGKKIKQQSVNIPVNLRYGIGLGAKASAYLAVGPQFAFNVGDSEHKLYENTTWKLSSSTFSFNVGAGVMLMDHLQIGANYNIVCGKTGELEVVEVGKTLLKGRANAWQIHASYYF